MLNYLKSTRSKYLKCLSTKVKAALKIHRATKEPSHPNKQQSPIFSLTKDTLEIIFDLLDPVDQACFALTCRDYLYLFWKVRGIAIWGPNSGPHTIHPALGVCWWFTTREKLGWRLQNQDWVFCQCRRLHPRKEYEEQGPGGGKVDGRVRWGSRVY